MSQSISIGNQQQAIFNSLVPPEGPKAVPQTLDFSQASSFLLDFTQAYDQKIISVVQTIWVDNFANTAPVKFTVAGTGQTIECPAGAQGVFPIISAIRTKITAISSGAAIVPCQFLNVPLPIGVWYKTGNAGGGAVTISSGAVSITRQAVTAAAAAAHSIAAAATAVTVFAAGAIVTEGVITNPNAATESLFVDLVNVASDAAPGANGTTTELVPGQSFTVPGGLSNAVTACAATAGHAFTAWRY